MKPMTSGQFCAYEEELVGADDGRHKRLAALMGTSEIGVKRFATGGRTIPDYIAQSIRALVLLRRQNLLDEIGKMP